MPSASPNARPPRLQFGLSAVLLTMLVVGVAAAGFAGLADSGDLQAGAIILVLVAPFVLMILLSTFQSLQSWLARRRESKARNKADMEL